MAIYNTIPESKLTQRVIDTFGGYNHNLKIGEGEFFDMKNLCSDEYPLISNRRKRGVIKPHLGQSEEALHILQVYGTTTDGDGNLYVVATIEDEDNPDWAEEPQLLRILKKGNYTEAKYKEAENFSLMSLHQPGTGNEYQMHLTATKKMMFIAGNYLYIFPDKVYVGLKYERGRQMGQTVFIMICDTMEISATATGVTYSPCDAEGNVYTGQTVSSTEPASPTEGDIWVDTSETTHVWKKRKSSEWIVIPNVYVKISGVRTPEGRTWVTEGDGISVDITSAEDELMALNGSHIVIGVPDFGGVIITGLIDESVTDTEGSITVERKIPDMDFIVLAQNRLWGCVYHNDAYLQEDNLNEIYASKLGDFNNWNVFQGISTDSYAASVGTPGKWTGAANINGSPVFFKADHYHKVYVSPSGAHQIIDKPCHGVQENSSGSVVLVGDVCYYLSKVGVMAFDGNTFGNLGDAFGDVRYVAADGGAVGDKYYISMQAENGTWAVFAYDTRKHLWHKEDDTHAQHFTNAVDDAFFITEDTDGNAAVNIVSNYDVADTYEADLKWEAVTGLQGYDYMGEQYISRFNIRMTLPYSSYMDIFVEYDSNGVWEHQGHLKGAGTKSFVIPVRPRRCDHFRIKLSGKGEVKIYSFAKMWEGGSDIE